MRFFAYAQNDENPHSVREKRTALFGEEAQEMSAAGGSEG